MLNLNPWNLIFTVANLLVLFLLIKKFLFKPVNEIIRKREEMIAKQFADAQEKMSAAEETKKQYEASLADAKQESFEILADARKAAQAEHDRIVKNAGLEAGKIVEDAKQVAKLEQKKALQDAESEIASMAVKAAEKILEQRSNDEKNQEIYNQFLAKVGEPRD